MTNIDYLLTVAMSSLGKKQQLQNKLKLDFLRPTKCKQK